MKDFDRALIKNLKAWSKGLKKGPLLATLRVTNVCDLKCKFCTAKDEKPSKDELTIKDYKILFPCLKKRGVKLCGLVGGGELLCRKRLTIQLVRLIKKNGMTGWLVTNGVNFDAELIKKLILAKLDTVLFSIDGSNAQTHDCLRGKNGVFDKAIKNIKLFDFWKNKLKTEQPEIKLQMLVTRNNYLQIEDMIRLTQSLKANQLLLNFLVEHTPECKNLKLQKKEFDALKKRLNGLLKNKSIKEFTNFQNFVKIMNLTNSKKVYRKNKKYFLGYCYQPWYHLNITEKGDINFCPEIYRWHKENIKEKSINQIWYGKNFEKFRMRIKEKELITFCNEYCNLPIIVENLNITKQLKNELRTRKNN